MENDYNILVFLKKTKFSIYKRFNMAIGRGKTTLFFFLFFFSLSLQHAEQIRPDEATSSVIGNSVGWRNKLEVDDLSRQPESAACRISSWKFCDELLCDAGLPFPETHRSEKDEQNGNRQAGLIQEHFLYNNFVCS